MMDWLASVGFFGDRCAHTSGNQLVLNSAVCTAQQNVYVTSIVKPLDVPMLCVVS